MKFFPTDKSARNVSIPIIGFVVLTIGFSSMATAQSFTTIRLDGNRSTRDFDPVVSEDTFRNVGAAGGDNINGASVIRVPDWIPANERIHPDARYYMYFSNHSGDDIRLAWASSILATWNLFNGEGGNSTDRAWGSRGNNSGTRTPGNGVFDIDIDDGTARPFEDSEVGVFNHVASPDVHVDNDNRRIVMYFHGEQRNPVRPFVANQKTFVATSKYGLNFNPESNGGEDGQGMREVVPGDYYFRTFEVGGHTFAYSNNGELWKAPPTNDAGQVNNLSNADSEGGWWNPSRDHDVKAHWWTQRSERDNPIEELYRSLGEGIDDPRHFAIYTRNHIDSSDTNVYVFYTAKYDAPERILMTVIDTRNGSTNPGNWSFKGQEEILVPELDWEGGNQRIAESEPSRANGVRQLRDPYIFEDDRGTSTTADDQLFIFYSGGGEDAIGVARLNPVVHITKRNASGFALDGNRGAGNRQNVYLWSEDKENRNQQWVEIARGNGYFTYQKVGTNHCLDGGNGGTNGQNLYLYECDDSNHNQHFLKSDAGSGFVKLIKRNAPIAIDGAPGASDGQNVQLYNSGSSSQNLQWHIGGVN